jgi:hypothetical protein
VKYRIVKQYGKYFVQYKFLWFWFFEKDIVEYCHGECSFERKIFNSVEEAEDFISKEMEKRKWSLENAPLKVIKEIE